MIAAVLNLFGDGKTFVLTKPILLPILALYYCFRCSGALDLILISALLACFLGDVFLMLKGKRWFFVGGTAFLTAQTLLMIVFFRQINFSQLPVPVVIMMAFLYCFVIIDVWIRISQNTSFLMRFLIIIYLSCNATMNLSAFFRMLEYPNIWSVISYVGAVLFFLSDSVLFLLKYETNRTRFYKSDFFVMLAYIFGVLLIVFGLSVVGR